MRRVLCLAVLVCGACYAQNQDDSRPAGTNVRGAEYPRIHSDLRVTFKVKAPAAQKVQVQPGTDGNTGNNGFNGLGKDPYDMVRDPDGKRPARPATPDQLPGAARLPARRYRPL
jgi:hypothetical protein